MTKSRKTPVTLLLGKLTNRRPRPAATAPQLPSPERLAAMANARDTGFVGQWPSADTEQRQ